jgi:hypothetical protein
MQQDTINEEHDKNNKCVHNIIKTVTQVSTESL